MRVGTTTDESGFFFFNDTATTEIYTLSLHDALPISKSAPGLAIQMGLESSWACESRDRKSTRLNSSHLVISYAVFCLKKQQPQHSPDRNLPPPPRRALSRHPRLRP